MTTPETPAATLRRAAEAMREHPERFLHRAAALAIADEMDMEADNIERRLPDDSGSAAQWLRIARACLNEPDPAEVEELTAVIRRLANGTEIDDLAHAILRAGYKRERGTAS